MLAVECIFTWCWIADLCSQDAVDHLITTTSIEPTKASRSTPAKWWNGLFYIWFDYPFDISRPAASHAAIFSPCGSYPLSRISAVTSTMSFLIHCHTINRSKESLCFAINGSRWDVTISSSAMSRVLNPDSRDALSISSGVVPSSLSLPIEYFSAISQKFILLTYFGGWKFINSALKVLHNISGNSFGSIDSGNFTQLV